VANATNGQLDILPTSTEPTNTAYAKHVHCTDTDDMFSMSQFGSGKYDNSYFTPHADMTTLRDYIAVVAISSIRLAPFELRKLASDDGYASKMENWQRLAPKAVPRPKLGDDAYWAMNSVRNELKMNVLVDREAIHQCLRIILTRILNRLRFDS
jgi:hypothetical protein